jgi:hypothetical protein
VAGAVWLRHVSAGPAGAPAAERWVFLCQDYPEQRRFEEALGGGRIDAAPALRRAAAELRAPFLQAIAELGRSHASPEWWASSVPERNTLSNPLFLRCCYLRAALELAADPDRDLLVVSESGAVLESLARELGARARWAGRPPRSPAGLRLRRIAGYLVRGISHRLRRPPLPDPPSGRLALIRTWVDEGTITPEGRVVDRYFPGLAEWLAGRGFDVVTMPVLYSLERSWADAWRALAPNGYLAPEGLYRAVDYAYALRAAVRLDRIRFDGVRVGGMDVSLLFDEERRRTAFDGGTMDSLLMARLPRRLAERGWRPEVVFDPYENLPPGKELILGLREDMPDAKLVGYEHSTVPPMLLSWFLTAGEAEVGPVPDRVVCNGPFFRDVLVEHGLPAERAVLGPALRYRHVFDAPTGEGEGVFITLPLNVDGATELFEKSAAALHDLGGVRVWVKAHPMFPRDAVAALELPPGFEVVGGEMRDWLPRSRVVLGLASSTVIEALAAGVPPIPVGRDAALDLNPLGWFPELGEVVSSPDDIRRRVEQLLALSPAELEDFRRRGREVLERCFSPVTEETMAAFLDW